MGKRSWKKTTKFDTDCPSRLHSQNFDVNNSSSTESEHQAYYK
jgi:hypothetical protein